jgi:hypothetical protein
MEVSNMKIFLIALGVILIVVGGIWLLQGLNIFPGSAMSGVFQWVVIGGIAAVVGLVILVVGIARKRAKTGTGT